jgi:hypothetical protein
MIRNIQINAVLNGVVVQVGWTAVVFESAPQMLEELGKYLADPDATEKSYQTDSINSNKLGLVAAVEREVPRGLALGNAIGGVAGAVLGGQSLREAVDQGRLANLRTASEAFRMRADADPGDRCVGEQAEQAGPVDR